MVDARSQSQRFSGEQTFPTRRASRLFVRSETKTKQFIPQISEIDLKKASRAVLASFQLPGIYIR